ncbi:MAG: histidine kinase [Solirubrobacteraceae bacterium]|jgi:signal transduction histidine kinase
MLLARVNPRLATVIRLAALVLIGSSVLGAHHPPGASGRALVITVAFVGAIVAWLAWVIRPVSDRGLTPDLYLIAAAGGVLCGASPDSAASTFVFVAVAVGGLRVELGRTLPLVAVGALGLGVSVLVYNGSALGLLAYTLGFLAAALAASNARQAAARADQAELLLAQTQRSHEEQLRAARLEESSRLAREIHDVLAHTLAGLTIQLEATTSLLEQGADRDTILARVRRAHGLARQGLEETRQAVGALRGEQASAPSGIEALVADYGATADARADLTIDGNPARLTGPTGQTVLRVVQEALTNVRKHAPGAGVSVAVDAGANPGDEVVLRVDDLPAAGAAACAPSRLAASGGGYGLQGMRERAQLLGGTLSAGPTGAGWRVELRLPAPEPPAVLTRDAA